MKTLVRKRNEKKNYPILCRYLAWHERWDYDFPNSCSSDCPQVINFYCLSFSNNRRIASVRRHLRTLLAVKRRSLSAGTKSSSDIPQWTGTVTNTWPGLFPFPTENRRQVNWSSETDLLQKPTQSRLNAGLNETQTCLFNATVSN